MDALATFNPIYWLTQTAAMALTALLIPKLRVTSIFGPLLAVATLSVINSTVWSSGLFSKLPDSLTTQTLSLLAINGAIFWIVVKILPGIEVDGVLPSLVAPIVFTICSILVPKFASEVNWGALRSEAARVYQDTKTFVETAPEEHSQHAHPRGHTR